MEAEVDLGVCIDSELNFSDQIKLRIGKANRMVGAIRRSFQFLNACTFVTLYKSMVRCHLEYAVPVWFPCLQRDIDALEEVQKRATKMLACTKELNYADRLRLLKLPTLVYRRHRGDLIELFKMINGMYDGEVLPRFDMRSDVAPTHSRRHTKQVLNTYCNKSIRANFFTKRVAPVWNNLTQEVVDAPSVDSFKRRLDKLWENHPMKYNYKEPVMNF